MPTENDDDDHDLPETTTRPAATVSLPPKPDATKPGATSVPSDHPQRPTKPAKPSGAATASASSSASGAAAAAAAATATAGSWLPAFLPTFGASPHTLAWIYGAMGLIVLFVVGLGTWWWIMRRRQLRNSPRDGYEFELLNEEEGERLAGAGGAEKGQKRRGGELYDAFAGGSEDEDEDDSAIPRQPRRTSLDSDDNDDDSNSDGARNEKPGSRLLSGSSR